MTGPHGGELVRGYERITCPICRSVGTWSKPRDDLTLAEIRAGVPCSVYTPPPGHRLVLDADGRYVRDYCLGSLTEES